MLKKTNVNHRAQCIDDRDLPDLQAYGDTRTLCCVVYTFVQCKVHIGLQTLMHWLTCVAVPDTQCDPLQCGWPSTDRYCSRSH